MKKTSIFLGLMAMGFFAGAQTRMALFEEFTGENCGPCAATNPALNTLLANNSSKVIALKWQVPIPSAPSATWSLYKTNQGEIDWRYKSTGYNYQSQNTSTTAATNGINSAPQGRLDGQHQWTFGAASDHPANLTAAAISSAQAQTTPFSISITPVYNAAYTTATVNVTINSSAAATLTTAIFRLCLVERTINFATAPGTNGEKDFADVVRKSYPTTTSGTVVTGMGTAIPNTWTAAQTQTLSIVCPIPSYIVDLSQMAFVGFIQDDGNKKVWQAARSAQPNIPNDAKVVSVNAPAVSCSNSITPSVVVKNNGTNAITAVTITPFIDGTAQTPYTTTLNLAGGATTTLNLNAYAATGGAHTLSVNISGVSGGDINTANNTGNNSFALVQNYIATPLAENFPTTTFPTANWFKTNPDGGAATWGYNAAGNGNSGSAKYDFYNNGSVGDADELYMPPANLTGTNNPVLSFDVAYAQYSNENDKLEVKVSTDCGNTWTTVYMKAGTTLTTVPAQTAAFTPATANQWRTETVNLPTLANNATALMKFVATSAYGNNLYIDNVNMLNSAAGIKTNTNEFSVSMFPNPATESTNLTVNTNNAGSAKLVVYNTIGQLVFEKSVSLNQGFNNIVIDTKNFSNGVYNVILSGANGTTVNKLTVNK